jgi:citrate lyase subunit beta/citryl-CoA lyase
VKPIRSFLYAPGNRERLIEKAPESGADAVMFDLADSVPPAEKGKARRMVSEALSVRAGANLYVKLNDADSGLIGEDVDAVARRGLCGVLLPKVEDTDAVRRLDALLAERERARGLPEGGIEMILLLETATAILRAYDLTVASPRVVSLCCATAEGGDLIRSLGSAWSIDGPERTYLRGLILLAARAAGLPWPIDGVFTNLEDQDGLEAEARLARRTGFRGKLAIHPKQIQAINRIFSPTETEIAWSRRVVAAWRDGKQQVEIDGFSIGDLGLARAEAILAEAAHFSG